MQDLEYKGNDNEYEYNDSDYEYTAPKTVDSDILLNHPEMVHTELFKNVPVWPEPDISGSNLHVQKSENMESETDPKLLDGSEPKSPDFDTTEFESSESYGKKLGKIEVTIKGENDVYPKDAPYTQGGTGLKFSSTYLTCLTLLVLYYVSDWMKWSKTIFDWVPMAEETFQVYHRHRLTSSSSSFNVVVVGVVKNVSKID